MRSPFQRLSPASRIVLAFALPAVASAEVRGLCNTGQTQTFHEQCTGVLIAPNPPGGGGTHDGNWALAFPYPSAISAAHGPCALHTFIFSWVDTPNVDWLPNSVSPESEWITPAAGETNIAPGWYVYVTKFPVPAVLPHGAIPTSVTINGRLSSDNETYAIYIESPANSGICAAVNLPEPLNNNNSWNRWTDFSFTQPVTAGAAAYLIIQVINQYNSGLANGASPAGLRVQFSPSSRLQ